MSSQDPAFDTLAAGELISTATLTNSVSITAGEMWRAEADGIALQPIALTL